MLKKSKLTSTRVSATDPTAYNETTTDPIEDFVPWAWIKKLNIYIGNVKDYLNKF